MTSFNAGDANPELERILDDYLAGESKISRQYHERARELTPAELDKTVLAAAHEKDSAAKPPKKSSRRPSRWLQRLAAVAVLALGLALTLDLLQDQSIVPVEQQPPAPATRSGQDSPDTPLRTDPEATTRPESARPESVARSATATPEQDSEEPEALAPNREQADAPEPKEPELAEPGPIEPEPTEPEPVESSPPGIEGEPIQAPPVPAQVTPPSPEASAPREIEQRSIAQPRSQAGPGQTPPSSRSGPAQEPYSGPPLPQAPAASGQTPGEPAYRETAQTWMRHIVFLADTGQRDEARAELSKYRQRHPQASVPAELQELDNP